MFLNKQAIVIGPTPPGTGVIAEAFFSASLTNLLISLSIFVIYLTGVPWLAYLAGWEVAYIWGIKNFILAEIFKISILALSVDKLLKLRKFT